MSETNGPLPVMGPTIDGLVFLCWPGTPDGPGHWVAMTPAGTLALGGRMVALAQSVMKQGAPTQDEVLHGGHDTGDERVVPRGDRPAAGRALRAR